MSDADALLRAICDQPADDTARLVYADFLEEAGDPARAEFIRVEVELANRPPGDPHDEARRRDLFARRSELLKAHKPRWLAPFLPYARDTGFERGFVQEIEVPGGVFLHHGPRWMALTPLTRLRVTDCREWESGRGYTSRVGGLFASPLLSRLERLDLHANEITAGEFEKLSAHPDLSRLRVLNLRYNRVGNAGAIALASMPQLRGLEELDLVANGITDSGARAVAQSCHLGGLKELSIGRNSFGKRTWTMLELRFGIALVG